MATSTREEIFYFLEAPRLFPLVPADVTDEMLLKLANIYGCDKLTSREVSALSAISGNNLAALEKLFEIANANGGAHMFVNNDLQTRLLFLF